MTLSIGQAALRRPGTVVLFPFPQSEKDVSGKARPCLVIATSATPAGHRIVLAYGTTAPTDANRGFDLSLDAQADWQAAGLHRPIRFVLARRITVLSTDPRLNGETNGTRVLGTLPRDRAAELAGLTALLGDTIFEDHPAGAPLRRPVRHRHVTMPRRNRTASHCNVIVEYRRRRTSRSTPSAA